MTFRVSPFFLLVDETALSFIDRDHKSWAVFKGELTFSAWFPSGHSHIPQIHDTINRSSHEHVTHILNSVTRGKLAKLDARLFRHFELAKELLAIEFRHSFLNQVIIEPPNEEFARAGSCNNKPLMVHNESIELFIAYAGSKIIWCQLNSVQLRLNQSLVLIGSCMPSLRASESEFFVGTRLLGLIGFLLLLALALLPPPRYLGKVVNPNGAVIGARKQVLLLLRLSCLLGGGVLLCRWGEKLDAVN